VATAAGGTASEGSETQPLGDVALTYVAVVHPDALPVVPAPAFHHVIGVVGFSDFVVWVDDNLWSNTA